MARKDPPREHLFKPGKSGNPGGRPKGPSAATCLTGGMSREEWAKKITDLCKNGSIHALTIYANYVFGKPQENVSLSGGISMYEQGATQPYDKKILLSALKQLTGAK